MIAKFLDARTGDGEIKYDYENQILLDSPGLAARRFGHGKRSRSADVRYGPEPGRDVVAGAVRRAVQRNRLPARAG